MGYFDADDEYIYMCRKGDELAWRNFLNRYRPFIYTWIDESIKTYRYLSTSREELFNEMIPLWHEAVFGYRPEYGIFYAYAKMCLTRDLVSFLRSQMSQQSRAVKHAISLDQSIYEDEGITYVETIAGNYWNADPVATFQVQEAWETVNQVIDEELTPLEKSVFLLHQSGFNYHTISAQLSLSPKKVDNLLQKIKTMLKRRLQS